MISTSHLMHTSYRLLLLELACDKLVSLAWHLRESDALIQSQHHMRACVRAHGTRIAGLLRALVM
jgi:hypothetical protein